MAQCHTCKAELKGNVNFWHQEITVTDNPNKRENIKFPVSWSSEMLSFCCASCLSDYVHKYSGETISQAKLNGAPNGTGIVSILNEPYKYNNQTKQQLNKEGFEKLKQKGAKNDGDKGDGRKQVGLATPEEIQSQKPVFDKLKELKNKENNMETQAKITRTCDNCKAVLLKDDDDKQENIKATLSNVTTGKNQEFLYCDENCLREHLNTRHQRKKVKKSKASNYEIDMTVE